MSSKDLGSTENLLGASGRVTSRSTLVSSGASMDDILDKLKLLNYHKDFCKPNQFPLLHRFYFLNPHSNPNEQLYYFTSLFGWLMKVLNRSFETPGQFDDPNATCATIAGELKKLGIAFDFGPAKLKQGYGEAVLYALQSVVDLAITESKLGLKKPVQRLDDYPEEAEVDMDAEVTTEMVEVEANDEEDETFMDLLQNKKNDQEKEVQPLLPKTDPQEWKLEVERVSALLKIQLPNNNKDWRIHLQQMDYHEKSIKELMEITETQLKKISNEIQQTLEQISSREKYINSQFEPLIEQYKSIQDQSSDLKQKYTVSSSTVSELTNELSKISEDLDSVKSKMDELGNGMTDSKPLISIKQGLAKLKTEMKQMDLRTGVIEHTLLHAKMSSKAAPLEPVYFAY
ncbi:intra-flagellar transport protein 57 [Gorgonomyces haynaldii]|nr:intra-flagellar transport protein 57 [Gorgonomyces haynaldii]